TPTGTATPDTPGRTPPPVSEHPDPRVWLVPTERQRAPIVRRPVSAEWRSAAGWLAPDEVPGAGFPRGEGRVEASDPRRQPPKGPGRTPSNLPNAAFTPLYGAPDAGVGPGTRIGTAFMSLSPKPGTSAPSVLARLLLSPAVETPRLVRVQEAMTSWTTLTSLKAR